MLAKLNELLPPEACNEISALIEGGEADIANLKRITNRHVVSLLAKGVDADYLAYAILNAASQIVRE